MVESEDGNSITTPSAATTEPDLILTVKLEPAADEATIEYSDGEGRQESSGVLRPEPWTPKIEEPETLVLAASKTKSIPASKHSSKARLYQCDQCRRRFSTYLSLQVHFDFQHMGVRKCRRCNTRFPTPSSLEAHLETAHQEGSTFTCKGCMINCSSAVELERHKRRCGKDASKVFVQKLKTPRSYNKKSGMLQTNSPNSSQPAQGKGKTLEENVVPSKTKSPVEKALSSEMPYPNGTTNEAKDGYEDEFFEADEEAESLGEEEMDTTRDDPDWVAPAALMKGGTQTVESNSDSLSSISNGGGEVTNSVREDNSKEPIEQHHEDQKSYVCRQCPTTFPNRSGFRVHLKAVHRVNKRFQCPHCSKAFRISFRLSEHVKMMHEGERKYCCRFCDGKFFVKSHLTRHVNIYHTNGTAVRCPQCYKVFRSEEKMKEHVLKEHAVVSDFACRFCDSSFQTWEECIEHGKKVHPDQPNASADYNDLQCRACGSAFDSLGDLRRHENTCTRVSRAITGSVDRFCCKECGMLFVLASSLRTHLSSVHGINPTEAEKVLKNLKGMPCFLCPFCHKTYTELRSLRRHLAESHLEDTGETDVTPEQLEDMENIGDGLIFECKHCGNVYSSRANLRKHELVAHAVEGSGTQHGSPGNYKCDLCDRYYFLLSNLRSHVIAVHNADPRSCSQGNEMQNLPSLQCRMCPRSFTTYSNLRRHLFTVHKAPKGTKVLPGGERRPGKPKKERLKVEKAKKIREKAQKPKRKEVPCPPPLTCTICGITLESVGLLVEHTTLVHTVQLRSAERTTVAKDDTRHYSCTLCSRAYTDLSKLRRHQAFDHRDTYPRKRVKAMVDNADDRQVLQNAVMYPLEIVKLPVDIDD